MANLFRFAALAACFLFAGIAHAQMSDYEREKIERVLYAPAVEKNLEIFDGEAFNPDADLDAAYTYMTGFVNGMNKAVTAINGMSGTARSSEEGQKLLAEAQDKLAYSKAMTNGFRAFEKRKKAEPSTAAAAGGEAGGDEGGLTEAQSAPVAEPLARLDALMESGLFDGAEIDMTVTTDEADAFADEFLGNANAAAKALNAMPRELRLTPGGKDLFAQVSERLKQAKALRSALTTHAEMRKDFEDAAGGSAETAAAPAGGDPATRAALDAFDALMADGRYDGKAFRADLPLEEAQGFSKELRAAANAVIEAYNAGDDSSLEAEVQKAANIANSMSGALANHRVALQRAEKQKRDAARKAEKEGKQAAKAAREAAREPHKAACAALAQELPDMSPMHPLVVYETTDWSKVGGAVPTRPKMTSYPGSMSELIVAVDEACAKPDYADMLSQEHGCADDASKDPAAWCRTASVYADEARAELERLHVTINSSYIPSVADLEFRDGFFLWPWGEPGWDAIMAKAKSELNDAQMAAFEKAVHEGASRWKPEPRADAPAEFTYGSEMASRIVERDYEDAEVIDTWFKRATWKINRNALGVILSRTNLGYVLYRREGEPYCTLREFVLKEPYAGGGSYQKAGGVRFAYLRYQDCDRR